MTMRLQKFLADAGVGSRRASEQIILEGRVLVNGEVVRELGTKVTPGHDRVVLDGRPLKTKKKLYIAINKPRGYICSKADPEGRHTVHDLLPREWSNLQSVGRLDYNSEGLIFYTNDGDFALRLTHPRYGIRKRYLVTIKGEVTGDHLAALQKGIYDGDEVLRAESARILKGGKSHGLLELVLTEGKNREVRRMFEKLGLGVDRLQRVQVGRVKLGELPLAKWRALTGAEIKSLIGSDG